MWYNVNERIFWLMIRRALLLVVHAIEGRFGKEEEEADESRPPDPTCQ
jgi:hypothetical protein